VRKQVIGSIMIPYADALASHKAIIAYLSSISLSSSVATLRQELHVGDSFDEATSKKYEGLLEKKWTSVVRLQKKVRYWNYYEILLHRV
jgi:hypothetical protein